MSEQTPPPVVNTLPAAVVALAAVVFGVECLFQLADRGFIGGAGGIGIRVGAIEDFAFYPQALAWMLESGQTPLGLLMRFVTYPLLHVSITHAIFVCVFVLAMGKMVGEAFGNLSVLILFFGASIGGALAYGLFTQAQYPLIGGFPGVYGLVGGYTFLLWVQSRMIGSSQLQAFRLIAFLMGAQLLFGAILGAGLDWIADLAGFVAGFGLSFLMVPGGWSRLRDMLRNR